jgi:alginate O-acetyltransferase complex protein AlgI
MVGIVFMLHFGLFHLLSLLWHSLGIHAKPMMMSPGTATSLSKFWGRSWNAAFTDLMREQLFKPLAKHHGAHVALFTIFLLSGALHELVISLPAHGGYGLPTVYFTIQGLGLLFERSTPGRKLGLGSGWKGWCFVAVTTGVPAFWLFHPVFIHNVILPMLNIIGAT